MKKTTVFPTDPKTYDAHGNERSKRMKLDPDLADGQHWTIHDRPDDVFVQMISSWMEEALPGDSITIELVAMSDAEEAALPEV